MLISVEHALNLIKDHANIWEKADTISVEDAFNRILAEDIFAPLPLPPFRQSIMDGYALVIGETLNYRVVGEIKTGDSTSYNLKAGEAVRIFTGAQLPDSANAVVMQEHVIVRDYVIQLKEVPKIGQHIRNVGEQIEKGDMSLVKGDKLNPSSIGILKSFGLESVTVTRLPKISIISTGNELVIAGQKLQAGQIYESNSQVIRSALQQKGLKVLHSFKVKDSLDDTQQAIEDAISSSDIVLISGGISVGDYDFVSTALNNLGVEEIFYKVLQKPGKPLYFGKKDSTYVFALPGNPASTLTCLYVYVFTLIDAITNSNNIGLKRIQFPISEDFENPFGKALFLKATLEDGSVTILNQQNSAMILSFARADALVYIPADCIAVRNGQLVTTILLPQIC